MLSIPLGVLLAGCHLAGEGLGYNTGDGFWLIVKGYVLVLIKNKLSVLIMLNLIE